MNLTHNSSQTKFKFVREFKPQFSTVEYVELLNLKTGKPENFVKSTYMQYFTVDPVNPLQHLENRAAQAHNNTSFSPEKRGAQMVNDYGDELLSDMQELYLEGISGEIIAEYKNRYERFFSSYLNAKSNTFSVMITGAGNFPVRRHEKANRSERKHYEVFREWRERAKKAIVRKAKPVTTFLSELDRYRNELAALQANHEKMKAGNQAIKKALKTKTNIDQYLIDNFNIAPHMLERTMQFGFYLQNSNANIKRVQGRILEIGAKEKKRLEEPAAGYKFEGGEVVINYEADRIQIFFDTRPTRDELTAWKAKGLSSFNWSPTNNAWQRKITNNALYATKHMLISK